jgi:hypothetical protein
MAAFEVICTLAAMLFICCVVVAVGIVYTVMARLRARRRRINRLLQAVRTPFGLSRRDVWHLRWRDRVLRYYGLPRQRSTATRLSCALPTVLRAIEPQRLLANVVAFDQSRNVQRRNEYR